MRKLVFVLLLSCVGTTLFAQYFHDEEVASEPRNPFGRFETKTWKTAAIAPKGELHLSVLAPARWGLTESVELQMQLALAACLVPNLYLKKNWSEGRLLFSSKHGVYYPSVGLQMLKNDGRTNTLTKNAKIPQILCIQNEIIFSYILNPSCNRDEAQRILTGRLGADFSLLRNSDDSFNRMTYFSLYHRTASFYGDKVYYLGLQLDDALTQRIYFNLGFDSYAVADDLFSACEMQANCMYHYNKKITLSLGAKFIMTDNPIERENHLYPTLDLCYRLGTKSIEKGLFRN